MVNIEKKGNVEVVSFEVKKINALNTEELKEQVVKVFDNQNVKVMIDLKGVEYIDSSGFGLLLSMLRAARNSYGTLKIASPEAAVKTVFETLHLHTIFEIFGDSDDCLKSFR